MTDMEIHIKGGKVKVFEGPARRVFHTTEEALGLSLLKLNPSEGGATVELRWVDLLGSRGLAIAPAGGKLVCLQTFPSHKKTLNYIRGDVNQPFTVTIPDVLMATNFKDGHLQKASLYVVKPQMLGKLSTTSTDPTLTYWPYGNVYSHAGICWGTTPIRDIHSPQEAFDAFFSSGFNGDLFAMDSSGLLNFLKARAAGDGIYPVQPASSFTVNCVSVAQAIARV